MTAHIIDIMIFSDGACRTHRMTLTDSTPEERDDFGNLLRPKDRRVLLRGGNLAEKAARHLSYRFRFSSNENKQLVWDDDGKRVSVKELRELCKESFIFVEYDAANSCFVETDAPASYIKLELEMFVAWKRQYPDDFGGYWR
jgi:hypothetical protein